MEQEDTTRIRQSFLTKEEIILLQELRSLGGL